MLTYADARRCLATLLENPLTIADLAAADLAAADGGSPLLLLPLARYSSASAAARRTHTHTSDTAHTTHTTDTHPSTPKPTHPPTHPPTRSGEEQLQSMTTRELGASTSACAGGGGLDVLIDDLIAVVEGHSGGGAADANPVRVEALRAISVCFYT
jgi:hypothetical protein